MSLTVILYGRKHQSLVIYSRDPPPFSVLWRVSVNTRMRKDIGQIADLTRRSQKLFLPVSVLIFLNSSHGCRDTPFHQSLVFPSLHPLDKFCCSDMLSFWSKLSGPPFQKNWHEPDWFIKGRTDAAPITKQRRQPA